MPEQRLQRTREIYQPAHVTHQQRRRLFFRSLERLQSGKSLDAEYLANPERPAVLDSREGDHTASLDDIE